MAFPIVIKIDLDDEFAEPGHKMGITEEGFEKLGDALMELNAGEMDVRPASEVAWPG